MRVLKRILLAVGALVAVAGYVWVASVRAVPGVKRRKQAARQARGA